LAVAGPAFLTLQWSGGGDQRGLLQRLTLPVAEVGSKDYLGLVPELLTSYWARFGWMDVKPLTGVTAVWSVLLALATLGWVLRCHEGNSRWVPIWLLLASAVFGWMLTLGSSNQVQGRFLFPLTGVIALLIGRGIGSLPVPGMAVAVAVAATACNAAGILQLRGHYRPMEWPADLVIDARQCDADRIVLETLSSGAVVGQTFVCSRPGLAAIDVVFSGDPRGSADVRLVLEDETTGRMFREATLPLTDIRVDRYTRFSFAPVMKSGCRLLRFSLRVTDPDPEGTFSLRFALGDPYIEGVRLVEGNPRDGDLRFVAWADKAAEVLQ
jgi:hypothetical protein